MENWKQHSSLCYLPYTYSIMRKTGRSMEIFELFIRGSDNWYCKQIGLICLIITTCHLHLLLLFRIIKVLLVWFKSLVAFHSDNFHVMNFICLSIDPHFPMLWFWQNYLNHVLDPPILQRKNPGIPALSSQIL